jgi:hypothetical protein
MAPLFNVVRLHYETMYHNNIKQWAKQTDLKGDVSDCVLPQLHDALFTDLKPEQILPAHGNVVLVAVRIPI